MVAAAVSDVDVSKVFVGKQTLDPIYESVALVYSEEWVDEDSFMRGGDERCGCLGL